MNDNGVCKNECSDERPNVNAGVCGCADGLEEWGNGLCCSNNSFNGSCAQEMQRKMLVKEYCILNDKSGICKNNTECKTMTLPAKGTCSMNNEVCCVVEAPHEINAELVAKYLTNMVCIVVLP